MKQIIRQGYGLVFPLFFLFLSCTNGKTVVTETSDDNSVKTGVTMAEEFLETVVQMQGTEYVFCKEDSFDVEKIPTSQYVSRIAVSPDRSLLAYGDNSKDIFNENGAYCVTVLSTSDYSQRYLFNDNLSSIQAIDFNNASNCILVSDHRKIVLHELKRGKSIATINALNYITDVRFIADDKIVVLCGLDKVAYLYSNKGDLLNTFNTGTQINAMTINSAKNELVLAGHSKIQLWSLDDVALLKELPTNILMSATINPSKTQIAFGAHDGTIQLYTTDLMKVGELEGHFMPVLDVDYSANGGMLISGSSDQSFRIWNTKTQEEILEVFNEHRSMVHAVRFVNVANDFATGGDSNELKIWRKEEVSKKTWINIGT